RDADELGRARLDYDWIRDRADRRGLHRGHGDAEHGLKGGALEQRRLTPECATHRHVVGHEDQRQRAHAGRHEGRRRVDQPYPQSWRKLVALQTNWLVVDHHREPGPDEWNWRHEQRHDRRRRNRHLQHVVGLDDKVAHRSYWSSGTAPGTMLALMA